MTHANKSSKDTNSSTTVTAEKTKTWTGIDALVLTWLKLVPKGWGGDGVDEGLDFRG